MSIREWPADERPREKLLTNGAHTLSNAELLAIFLRTGTRGYTAIDLARKLLNNFDGLRGLLDASLEFFCQEYGMGAAKYVQLQAAIELGRRYLQSNIERNNTLNTPELTQNFLRAKLRHHQNEVFACLCLDSQCRMISYDELFHGTINTASVHPREIVKLGLKRNAAGIILAHNHPSGICEPSQSDQLITQQIKDALALVDIQVLDHIVVGESNVCSFVEMGWL